MSRSWITRIGMSATALAGLALLATSLDTPGQDTLQPAEPERDPAFQQRASAHLLEQARQAQPPQTLLEFPDALAEPRAGIALSRAQFAERLVGDGPAMRLQLETNRDRMQRVDVEVSAPDCGGDTVREAAEFTSQRKSLTVRSPSIDDGYCAIQVHATGWTDDDRRVGPILQHLYVHAVDGEMEFVSQAEFEFGALGDRKLYGFDARKGMVWVGTIGDSAPCQGEECLSPDEHPELYVDAEPAPGRLDLHNVNEGNERREP